LTEEYMRTFTSLGDMLRSTSRGRWRHGEGMHMGAHGQSAEEEEE